MEQIDTDMISTHKILLTLHLLVVFEEPIIFPI